MFRWLRFFRTLASRYDASISFNFKPYRIIFFAIKSYPVCLYFTKYADPRFILIYQNYPFL